MCASPAGFATLASQPSLFTASAVPLTAGRDDGRRQVAVAFDAGNVAGTVDNRVETTAGIVAKLVAHRASQCVECAEVAAGRVKDVYLAPVPRRNRDIGGGRIRKCGRHAEDAAAADSGDVYTAVRPHGDSLRFLQYGVSRHNVIHKVAHQTPVPGERRDDAIRRHTSHDSILEIDHVHGSVA